MIAVAVDRFGKLIKQDMAGESESIACCISDFHEGKVGSTRSGTPEERLLRTFGPIPLPQLQDLQSSMESIRIGKPSWCTRSFGKRRTLLIASRVTLRMLDTDTIQVEDNTEG